MPTVMIMSKSCPTNHLGSQVSAVPQILEKREVWDEVALICIHRVRGVDIDMRGGPCGTVAARRWVYGRVAAIINFGSISI